jgi:hypothetical protein
MIIILFLKFLLPSSDLPLVLSFLAIFPMMAHIQQVTLWLLIQDSVLVANIDIPNVVAMLTPDLQLILLVSLELGKLLALVALLLLNLPKVVFLL